MSTYKDIEFKDMENKELSKKSEFLIDAVCASLVVIGSYFILRSLDLID